MSVVDRECETLANVLVLMRGDEEEIDALKTKLGKQHSSEVASTHDDMISKLLNNTYTVSVQECMVALLFLAST